MPRLSAQADDFVRSNYCASNERRDASLMISAASSVIAVSVGVAIMLAVNQAGHGGDLLSLGQYLAPKGVLFGILAALPVLAGSQLLVDSARARKWAFLAAALITGLVGLLVVSWIVMWGVPPATLEGAWLWPLAVVPLVVSFLLFRLWLIAKRGAHAATESGGIKRAQ